MRFYKILFSFIVLFLGACNKDNAPANLIGKEKFVPLMVDVHLADGYLGAGTQIPDSLSYRGNGLYMAIFKRYGVDSAQFRKSFQYYSYHLNDMNDIYKEVVARLKAKNDSLVKLQAAEEMRKTKLRMDSTAKTAKKDSVKRSIKQDSIKKSKAKKVAAR
ncbi:MAG: DUF4296 domain-containing protein [Mucilaginibacter sp.]|uniref:DUF4296 domain-containing protein n=1 Tax=Mucilaginibacter sp. TaxID=1882438 RepID=UPI0034E591A3